MATTVVTPPYQWLSKAAQEYASSVPRAMVLSAREFRLLQACDALTAQLAECYRLTGADPDGDEDWRLAQHAVEEVKRLREELDCQYAGEDW